MTLIEIHVCIYSTIEYFYNFKYNMGGKFTNPNHMINERSVNGSNTNNCLNLWKFKINPKTGVFYMDALSPSCSITVFWLFEPVFKFYE